MHAIIPGVERSIYASALTPPGLDLGELADTSHCYAPDAPGCNCLSAKPTYLNKVAMVHVMRDHPERYTWMGDKTEVTRAAIQAPEILSRCLTYHKRWGHWTELRAVEESKGSGNYLCVVISLAKPQSDHADYHQIATVYPAKKRKFFTDEGAVRPEWQLYIERAESVDNSAPQT